MAGSGNPIDTFDTKDGWKYACMQRLGWTFFELVLLLLLCNGIRTPGGIFIFGFIYRVFTGLIVIRG